MAFRRRNKSYPFFSQEFLIQNHADIVFSLVIFILIGLMFEVRFSFFPLFHPRLSPSPLSLSLSPSAQLFVKTAAFTDVIWRGIKSRARRKCPRFLQTCCLNVVTSFAAQTVVILCEGLLSKLTFLTSSAPKDAMFLVLDVKRKPTNATKTTKVQKTRRREKQRDCFPPFLFCDY